MTLFHEIYGSYYRAVAQILTLALERPLSRREMDEVCQRIAGGESTLIIPDALLSGKWPLLRPDGTPLTAHPPAMPLTLLEKRWLKAVSLDPRVQLFDADLSFLDGVEPLFLPGDVIVFDRYRDGDDYADETYRRVFRTLLDAVERKRQVYIEYENRRGYVTRCRMSPLRLEYSEKDDCFRVLGVRGRKTAVFRVGRIRQCLPAGERPFSREPEEPLATEQAVLEITDFRNALERTSLHFSHFRKTVERTGERTYRMTLWYDPQDETELVMRVLQFGPVAEVVSPPRFVDEVKLRVARQAALLEEGASGQST